MDKGDACTILEPSDLQALDEDISQPTARIVGGGFFRSVFVAGDEAEYLGYTRQLPMYQEHRRSARIPLSMVWDGNGMYFPFKKLRASDPRKLKESAWDKNPLSTKKPYGRKFK